jgi:hypothetical protein
MEALAVKSGDRFAVRYVALSFALLSGCGGGWSDSDTKSATDAVNVEHAAYAFCSDDGGMCMASRVRAMQRAAICANSSMLFRHDQPVPKTDISCSRP